ncbi:hypothetical protein LWI29_012580 [Acer saccharum]|uniref:Malectin-like domain-containing protein n=1 Tax=Acer saccharum TaxID=4024 RepID=A0AA39SPZ6_ACESA|nr:hypothetical protein LWI29_012580 [Acer saccharum]
MSVTKSGQPKIMLRPLRLGKDSKSQGATTREIAIPYLRYPEDVFDRYWDPYNEGNWSVMSTESALQSSADGSNYKVPDKLLQTAAAQNLQAFLEFSHRKGSDPNSTVIYFHFAEIEILDNGSNRELQIEVHGVRNLSSEPVTLEYLMPMPKLQLVCQ